MATITERTPGFFQAQVRRKGYPTFSKIFESKTQAINWAKGIEVDIQRGKIRPKPVDGTLTLGQALTRYERTVTPTKKGAKQELGVLKRIRLHCHLLSMDLDAIRASDWSQYRDKRLKHVCRTGKPVTGSTVCRELALVSHLYTTAVKGWGLELDNPILRIQKPKENPARSRRVESLAGANELDLICSHLPSDRARAGVLLLVETAARRGELVKLTWGDVDLVGRTARLIDTKNGQDRILPLSLKAVEILRTLHSAESQPTDAVLGLSADYISKAWQRARKQAGVSSLRVHDLRREGVSRLFEQTGMNTLQVAAISGHKTLSALQVYSRLKTSHLLAKLDEAEATAKAKEAAIATAKQSAIESTQANEVQA